MAVAESEYWWLASHRQKSHAVEHPQRTLADPFDTFEILSRPVDEVVSGDLRFG